MTLNLSPYDRETLDMLALLPINDAHIAELSNRVRAVMAARNNAEAKMARVKALADDLSRSDNRAWVASVAEEFVAALDGSGVTPE